MKEKIEALRLGFKNSLAGAVDAAALETLRVEYLGKKGAVAELMKGLRDVVDKKEAGQLINNFKNEVEEAIQNAETMIKEAAINAEIRGAKKYNPSLIYERELGSYHPITLASREVEEIFISMGFSSVSM